MLSRDCSLLLVAAVLMSAVVETPGLALTRYVRERKAPMMQDHPSDEFTKADLEDICLGDLIEAEGVLRVAEIAPDIERGLVDECMLRCQRAGYVDLRSGVAHVTQHGLAHYYRDRSFTVRLPGIE